ncbi:hypothetical protein LCGC14_0621250 [marine sediment metagenome]|uniref:Uncharacterized protein n=1 Tax=marine sediment metagenome TaxID=412755 RepID=A0A0F9UD85_9ZZZZ
MAKRKKVAMTNVTVRLSDDDLVFLDAYKRTVGRSRSDLIRHALYLLRINLEFQVTSVDESVLLRKIRDLLKDGDGVDV